MERLIKDKKLWVVMFKNKKIKVFNSFKKAKLYCNFRFWKGIDYFTCYFAHFTVNCFEYELEIKKDI